LEFIDTMGGLYERAQAANAAVGTVLARVRRVLLAAVGLPGATSDDRLVAVAAERLSLDGAQLAALLSNARNASVDPDLTGRQAVTIVRQLQKVAAQVDLVQRRHRKS
jgi:hypothetical protein